jgi:hypothetical protein
MSASCLGGETGSMLSQAFSESDVVDGARSRHRSAIGCFVGNESHEGAVHMQITTIGLDIAKNIFQVHGIDAAEKVIVRKQLRRGQVLAFFKALPPCLVGMEATIVTIIAVLSDGRARPASDRLPFLGSDCSSWSSPKAESSSRGARAQPAQPSSCS